jgi:hypothetical protein
MDGFNQPLGPPTVTDGLTGGSDTVRQGCGTDVLVGPQECLQVFLRDELARVLHKIGEQIKYLWFDLQRFTSQTEFIAISIEFVVAKDVDHGQNLLAARFLSRFAGLTDV